MRKNHVKKAGIFGSYSRGDQKKESDIDILVEFPKSKSLFNFIELKQELENVLGKKVDLVEYGVIKSRIKNRILKEEVRVM